MSDLSLRKVAILEIVSVLSSVLLIIWAVVPLAQQSLWPIITAMFLTLAFIGYLQHLNGESRRELGFDWAYFTQAARWLLLPVLLGSLVMLALGFVASSIHRSTNFWANLLIVPLWGVAQQYVLQGFIYRRLRYLMVDERQSLPRQERQKLYAMLAAAALFALVHLPNPALAMLSFLFAVIWSWVYERAPNLWALGLAHGWLSLIAMHSLPDWLMPSMSVGYKYFLYQRF